MSIHKVFKSIAEAVQAAEPGTVIHVGPGLMEESMAESFNSFNAKLSSDVQQSVEDMKNFMSKDVMELASQAGLSVNSQTVNVRGRKMVIPAGGQHRVNAILMACFANLWDSRIEAILRSMGVKGHFLAEDGTIEVRGLVDEVGAKAHETIDPKASPKMARNILIGDVEEKPASENWPSRIMGVLDAPDGKPVCFAVPIARKEGGIVEASELGGAYISVHESHVVWFAQASEIASFATALSLKS